MWENYHKIFLRGETCLTLKKLLKKIIILILMI